VPRRSGCRVWRRLISRLAIRILGSEHQPRITHVLIRQSQRQIAPDVATVIPAITGQTLAETDLTAFRVTVTGTTQRWLEVND
jgi:hypothetical protein